MTDRATVEASLAVHEAEALLAILEAARVSPRGATSQRELAARVTDALWWNYATPLGYVLDRVSLEDVVDHVARKLRVELPVGADVWEDLRSLTVALVKDLEKRGVSLEDLDPGVRARAWPSWWPTAALGVGSSGSLGAAWASSRVLALLNTPIGRLLPFLPPVAPYVGVIRTGATAVRFVGGPLGIALGVLAVNQSLGTNYHRLVPLLLGIGALGPKAVDEAQEVVDDAPAAPGVDLGEAAAV